MVAATLVYNILRPPSISDSDDAPPTMNSSFVLDEVLPAQPAAAESRSSWGDEREMAAWSKGALFVPLLLCLGRYHNDA